MSGGRLSALPETNHADVAEVERIAAERISRARLHIVLDHPYFAAAILQLPMRGTHDHAAAALIACDGRRMLYNHDAIAALDTPAVRLYLLHILMHILLDHSARGGSREWTRWQMAADIATNSLLRSLGIPMPPSWSSPHEYTPMSAEAIYENRCLSFPKKKPSIMPMADSLLPAPPMRSNRDADAAGTSDAFDTAAHGLEPLSELHAKSLGVAFRADLQQKLAGSLKGGALAEIEASGQSRIDWRRVLARFVGRDGAREWSLSHPNRKHLWRGIRLPGVVASGVGRVVVAIDTSGSMGRIEHSHILAEIDALRRTAAHELVVMQFDTALQAIATFTPWQACDHRLGTTNTMRMHGGGGTDIRVPFQWAEEERRAGRTITLLVVCTDGFGTLPERAPGGLPTLFLLTPQHERPMFGACIELE